jgi:hypothetical protein
MGEIIKLNEPDYSAVDEFVKELKKDNVTHGVIAYRCKDGGLQHILINPDHSTYLIGLLERVKMELIGGKL